MQLLQTIINKFVNIDSEQTRNLLIDLIILLIPKIIKKKSWKLLSFISFECTS